jgi:hypothetical protein
MYWFMKVRAAIFLFSAIIQRALIRFVCGYVKCSALSRSMCVTIDGVWIGYWIY